MARFFYIFFNKVFIALYVLINYIRYFFSHIKTLPSKTRTFIGSALILIIMISMLTYFIDTSSIKVSGNDNLNNAYDQLNKNRLNPAYDSFMKALKAFDEDKNIRGIYLTSEHLGDLEISRNNIMNALTHYDRALNIAQDMDYPQGQINLLIKYAKIKIKLNRPNAARIHYNDALKIAQTINSPKSISTLYTYIGNLEREGGNPEKARDAYQNALEIYRADNDVLGEANLHWNIGYLEFTLKNHDAALQSYQLARSLFQQSKDPLNEAHVVKYMARLENNFGNKIKSTTYYRQAETLYQAVGNTDQITALRSEAGQLLL